MAAGAAPQLNFLGLTSEADEAAIEEAMTLRMAQTLMEFGTGMAFVGRQVHLEVGGDVFYQPTAT